MTTREVVQRVLPLLERLSPRTLDKARLLQYLAARASVDWGLFRYLGVAPEAEGELGLEPVHLFEDQPSQEVRRVRRPACLPIDLEDEVVTEYKRLALARPLGLMSARLFEHFYRADFCQRCAYDVETHRQICQECRFAGRPVSFEPR